VVRLSPEDGANRSNPRWPIFLSIYFHFYVFILLQWDTVSLLSNAKRGIKLMAVICMIACVCAWYHFCIYLFDKISYWRDEAISLDAVIEVLELNSKFCGVTMPKVLHLQNGFFPIMPMVY